MILLYIESLTSKTLNTSTHYTFARFRLGCDVIGTADGDDKDDEEFLKSADMCVRPA
jgi:hypothetical protein